MCDNCGSDDHKVGTKHGPHRVYRGKPVGSKAEETEADESVANEETEADEAPLKGHGRHEKKFPTGSWPADVHFEDSAHIERDNYARLGGPPPALESVMHWGYTTRVVLD